MFELMVKGHENPSMQDYTKNNADITNKIRKTKSHYISEVHDNFRLPERYDKESLIFNYFDHKQTELIKKKTYSKMLEQEMEKANKSSYDQLLGKSLVKKVQQQVNSWLVAGKASRGKKTNESDFSGSPSPNRSPKQGLTDNDLPTVYPFPAAPRVPTHQEPNVDWSKPGRRIKFNEINKGRGLSNMPIEDLRKEMEAMLLIAGFGQCENKDLIKSFYDPS